MPERIQLRRSLGWRLPAGAVVVSRPTAWGNPFRVGRHGTAAECVELYRTLIAGYVCVSSLDNIDEQSTALAHARAHIDELRGKNLAYWCRRGQPCHADVLIEVANASDHHAVEVRHHG